MNYYNIFINERRESNNDINSVYFLDDFENDIVFSINLGCFFLSKFGLSCKYYKLLRKLKINYFKGKILLNFRSVILEFGLFIFVEYISLWCYVLFLYIFIL